MRLDSDGTVTLVVASATSRDAGIYQCTVSNEMGQVSSSARVTVKPRSLQLQPTELESVQLYV